MKAELHESSSSALDPGEMTGLTGDVGTNLMFFPKAETLSMMRKEETEMLKVV